MWYLYLSEPPDSHLLMVLLDKLSCSATSCWVKPLLFLSEARKSPIFSGCIVFAPPFKITLQESAPKRHPFSREFCLRKVEFSRCAVPLDRAGREAAALHRIARSRFYLMPAFFARRAVLRKTGRQSLPPDGACMGGGTSRGLFRQKIHKSVKSVCSFRLDDRTPL